MATISRHHGFALSAMAHSSARQRPVEPPPLGAHDELLRLGEVLDGNYEVGSTIGRGGMGVIYRGQQLRLQRPVAIKVLRNPWGGDHLERFDQEARMLARISHPNIVGVLDYGTIRERPYLVMELLEGENLGRTIAGGPLPQGRAFTILKQVVQALRYSHALGVVHRDLKPANIFVQVDTQPFPDRVKVVDFGLAKSLCSGDFDITRHFTRDGKVRGTLSYLSPEQITGGKVDGRTDVYALGIVLYEMLTGKPPFTGSDSRVMQHHLCSPLPPLRMAAGGAQASARLDDLLARMTAKARDDRYSIDEVFWALDDLSRPHTFFPPTDDEIPVHVTLVGEREEQSGLVRFGKQGSDTVREAIARLGCAVQRHVVDGAARGLAHGAGVVRRGARDTGASLVRLADSSRRAASRGAAQLGGDARRAIESIGDRYARVRRKHVRR